MIRDDTFAQHSAGRKRVSVSIERHDRAGASRITTTAEMTAQRNGPLSSPASCQSSTATLGSPTYSSIASCSSTRPRWSADTRRRSTEGFGVLDLGCRSSVERRRPDVPLAIAVRQLRPNKRQIGGGVLNNGGQRSSAISALRPNSPRRNESRSKTRCLRRTQGQRVSRNVW